MTGQPELEQQIVARKAEGVKLMLAHLVSLGAGYQMFTGAEALTNTKTPGAMKTEEIDQGE